MTKQTGEQRSPDGETRARRRTFRSLQARVTLFVFWATVITSLTVTAISANSVYGFLRGNIDQKFRSVLSGTAERIDLWYDQRLLEVGVFAASEILTDNVPRLRGRTSAAASRAEIEQYLSYLLESFPQYEALFLLDRGGETLIWVGDEVPLPSELRAQGARSIGVMPSEIHAAGNTRVQLVSAQLGAGDGRSDGDAQETLHAVLHLEALDGLLATSDGGPPISTLLVNADGRCVASSAGGDQCGEFTQALPENGAVFELAEYENAGGERVVGGALRLDRFGWSVVVEEAYDQAFAPVSAITSRVVAIDLAIVLLFGLGAYRIARSIVKPIEALSDAARRMSDGEEHVVIPEHREHDEVGILTRAFNAMTTGLANKARELEESRRQIEEAYEQLAARNDELQNVNEVLEQLSITDGLTKLHNHRFFQDHLTRETRRVDRSGEPLALILADIDHFKAWNDRLGHAAGDRILRAVADVFNKVIRETDLLARYGGEEFALLAPDTDLEGAIALAEKIRRAIAQHTFFLDPPSEHDHVALSFGVSIYRGDREEFFLAADRALYAAKAAGRDCVMTADEAESRLEG